MEHASYFYNQREHEEGLKYVFEMFDSQKQGWLERADLKKASDFCGLNLTDFQIEEIF